MKKVLKKAFRMDTVPYTPPEGKKEICLPQVNDIPADCLRAVKIDGVARRYPINPKQRKAVDEQIKNVWNLFGGIIDCLPLEICGIYVYDMNECKGMFATSDGVESEQPGKRAVIGIAVSAIERGGEYLAFLLMHEISHIAAGAAGHSPHYEAFLDWMILNFNRRYGANIRNDYVNFNDEEP